jgi:hypothetical protein
VADECRQGDGKPQAPRRCEKCGKTHGVTYDRWLKQWLCHWCWVATPPTGKRGG